MPTIEMQRGQKVNLTGLIDTRRPIVVELSIAGNAVYDFECFGLDANEKLSDGDYFIFFGQPQSPNSEISFARGNNKGTFTLSLDELPSSIRKISFVSAINAGSKGLMRDISTCLVTLSQDNNVAFRFELSGQDFHYEKALVLLEIYWKNAWRVAAVAMGSNIGLQDLARQFI